MRQIYGRAVFFLPLAIACLANAANLAAAENDSLCTAREETYFSCTTSSRLVAICGGKLHGNSYVQLRYGSVEHLAAAWPPPEAKNRGVTKGSVISQGTFGTYVRFAIDNDALVVFDLPGKESGLVTVVAAKIQSKESCREQHVSALGDAPVPGGSVFAVSVEADGAKH